MQASQQKSCLGCSQHANHANFLPIVRSRRSVRCNAASSSTGPFFVPSKRAPWVAKPLITTFEQQLQQSQQGRRASAASTTAPEAAPAEAPEYVVVNFYHLVDVENPQEVVEEHKRWVQANGLDIRGRIYISKQGMNAQFGGTRQDSLAYVDWLQTQALWQGLRFTVWPSPTGHAYPKLRLKYKPNLISMAGGCERMPVTDPSARATPLEPAQWAEMIANQKKLGAVVMDLRNDYEWDAGHFEGAPRPDEEEFAETPVGEGDSDVPSPLQGKSPDTPVLMYCTGGIRCDIYSTALKAKGFKNLYTLHGGIQGYFLEKGGDHWNGSLYVFDGRMAIGPEKEQYGGTAGAAAADQQQQQPAAAASSAGAAPYASYASTPMSGSVIAAGSGKPLRAAVPCQVCGSPDAELPHVNCANIDCNELFIACASCKTRYQGCCCSECMTAPRLLRPAKTDGGFYGAWGNYASDELASVIATGRSREGRVARRARRREAMKAKRERQAEERANRKAAIKEAMRALEASSPSAPAATEAPEGMSRVAALLAARRAAKEAAAGAEQASTAQTA